MNGIKLLKKDFDKIIHDEIELAGRLYSHFLAMSLSAKGINLNLIVSSPS